MYSSIVPDGTLGKQSEILQMMLNINTHDAPQIPSLNSIRNLQRVTPGHSILFFHVGQSKPNPRLPVLDRDLKMNAKIFFR